MPSWSLTRSVLRTSSPGGIYRLNVGPDSVLCLVKRAGVYRHDGKWRIAFAHKLAPEKQFYFVQNENCNCSECPYMRLNTLEKLRDCLRDLQPRVEIDPELMRRAALPIERMLAIQ
ncbi:MAG: quinolinate synthase NadA [Bryobacteraceae bacterium]